MFITAQKINHKTAYIGQTAKLPCRTTVSYYVDWRRLETLQSDHAYIYFSGHVTPEFQSRFAVDLEKTDAGDVYTLMISDVQQNDSVYYLCWEDGGFGNRHFFHLNVTGSQNRLGSLDIQCELKKATYTVCRTLIDFQNSFTIAPSTVNSQ